MPRVFIIIKMVEAEFFLKEESIKASKAIDTYTATAPIANRLTLSDLMAPGRAGEITIDLGDALDMSGEEFSPEDRETVERAKQTFARQAKEAVAAVFATMATHIANHKNEYHKITERMETKKRKASYGGVTENV